MIKVSTTGMVVSSKMDLRFPITGQWGHGARIIQVTLDDEARNTWGAIKYGVMDISEAYNVNGELACLLLEYIEENMSDEREVISQMIDETHCSETLYEINYKLQQMLKELLRNIDKITR